MSQHLRVFTDFAVVPGSVLAERIAARALLLRLALERRGLVVLDLRDVELRLLARDTREAINA